MESWALQELIINDGISYNILREILLSMLCNNGIAVAKHIFWGKFSASGGQYLYDVV